MHKNVFVFVVCGSAEHIQTLNYSLMHLKQFSKNEIWVVTDNTRNEEKINHLNIIDIKVSDEYSHHQASIFLKTGLHKFLPTGNNYCYLDTDVIALSEECDTIFEEFIPPILFAPDHCRLRKFSAYAVNCNCMARWKANRDIFTAVIENYDKNRTIKDSYILKESKALQLLFFKIKNNFWLKVFNAFKYFLSYPYFKLNHRFYFDRKNRTWHLNSGEIVMYEVNIKKVEKLSGLKYSKWNQKWLDKNGDDIWLDECNHLVEFIEDEFNIKVAENNWQHWNGGVFLFNSQSTVFLDSWHNKTLQIFKSDKWKTRDQGTLIATAWDFGLRHHPTLSKKFNFIADYYNLGVQLKQETNSITDDGFKHVYTPAFIHIYHHWQDASWPVWQWVESKLKRHEKD